MIHLDLYDVFITCQHKMSQAMKNDVLLCASNRSPLRYHGHISDNWSDGGVNVYMFSAFLPTAPFNPQVLLRTHQTAVAIFNVGSLLRKNSLHLEASYHQIIKDMKDLAPEVNQSQSTLIIDKSVLASQCLLPIIVNENESESPKVAQQPSHASCVHCAHRKPHC